MILQTACKDTKKEGDLQDFSKKKNKSIIEL